jgi:hypothetical protein
MNDGNIVHSTLSAATVFISTGSRPATSRLLLDTSAEGMFTMMAGAATSVTSTNRTAPSQILTNRARASLWVRFERPLPIADVAVTREPRQTPAIVEPEPSGSRDSAPEAPAPAPKKSAGAERIELAIDKLPNHELIKPIPVLVESLGDKVFIAEVPGLDISITGNSMGGVLLQLKERIANMYEGHRSSTNLSADKARELRELESYIGKTRRNWF